MSQTTIRISTETPAPGQLVPVPRPSSVSSTDDGQTQRAGAPVVGAELTRQGSRGAQIPARRADLEVPAVRTPARSAWSSARRALATFLARSADSEQVEYAAARLAWAGQRPSVGVDPLTVHQPFLRGLR